MAEKTTQEKIEKIQQQTARIEQQTQYIDDINKKANEGLKTAGRAEHKADGNRNTIKMIWGFISAIAVGIIGTFFKTL